MNKIFSYIFIIFTFISFGQELNCNVVVNATQTGDENLQIFKTLENQISEFINNTNWTKNFYTSKQRINCSMVINISNYDNNIFQGTIQNFDIPDIEMKNLYLYNYKLKIHMMN